eukprot:TRINITY_DN7988_c0_g1_i1.p1 TRINITY_DN7988_c0_g1~~TRINITY_DN7988_c0_g1_i1.p1  ORF type:complete len:303 (-),score=54.00 TRINITY_DN7988_c0_g1_i1:19-927(-)
MPQPRSGYHSDRFRRQFFKTQLCKFHQAGRCKRADRCVFAHSEEELAEPPNLDKTSLCPKGSSCRDEDCKFAHEFKELRCTEEFYKADMCNFFLIGQCKKGDSCRYSHNMPPMGLMGFACVPAGMPMEPQVMPSMASSDTTSNASSPDAAYPPCPVSMPAMGYPMMPVPGAYPNPNVNMMSHQMWVLASEACRVKPKAASAEASKSDQDSNSDSTEAASSEARLGHQNWLKASAAFRAKANSNATEASQMSLDDVGRLGHQNWLAMSAAYRAKASSAAKEEDDSCSDRDVSPDSRVSASDGD